MRKVLIPLNQCQTARAYGSGVTHVLEHWPTLQPLPISQSGGCTSPRCSFPAVLQSQAGPGYHKIQMAARPGTAWLEWTVAQGRRPGPRPGETTGRYSIFFFVERFNSPLSGESHSNPSQTARPGAYGQGSDTRAHRDCLNLNLPPDFSIGWLYVATLQHPSRAS